MKKIRPFKKAYRQWLTPKDIEVNSYVKWNVDIRSDWSEANLSLADCHRSITLSFNVTQTGLEKLDRLIGSFQEFRTYVVKGIPVKE